MVLSNNYTVPNSIDASIVEYFESGFNGAIDSAYSVTILILLSILAGCLFSAIIGFQRERNGHPAGFRTHLLIGLGSTLIMILSIYAMPGSYETRDPMRLAAAGVTGIGFLGAGAIIQNGFSVRGLTSAASIWVTMAIGMCAGCGYFVIGTIVTALSIIFLSFFHKIELKATSKNGMILIVTKSNESSLEKIMEVVGESGLEMSDFSTSLVKDGDQIYLRTVFRAKGEKKGDVDKLVASLIDKVHPTECKILH